MQTQQPTGLHIDIYQAVHDSHRVLLCLRGGDADTCRKGKLISDCVLGFKSQLLLRACYKKYEPQPPSQTAANELLDQISSALVTKYCEMFSKLVSLPLENTSGITSEYNGKSAAESGRSREKHSKVVSSETKKQDVLY